MEPINKQDVLIRLLKDGHINNEEFKALWEGIQLPVMRSGYVRTDGDVPIRYLDDSRPEERYQIWCGTGGSKIGAKELEKDSNGIELLDPLTKDEIESISKTFQASIKDMDKMKQTPFPFKQETMTAPFKQALTLLRDLADMQNGAPLLRYEKQYNELMQQVYDFLNEHEEPIEVCKNCEPIKDGFYLGMTCPKCNNPFRNVKQETTPPPQGMHPKTWAFLNKQSFC